MPKCYFCGSEVENKNSYINKKRACNNCYKNRKTKWWKQNYMNKKIICLMMAILMINSVQALQIFSYKITCCPFKMIKLNQIRYVNQSAIIIKKPIDTNKDMKKITSLLVQVHLNHTYTYSGVIKGEKKWNCLDYSLELTRILKENGFNAKCVFGNYAENPSNLLKVGMAHNWVELTLSNGTIIGLDPTFDWMPNNADYRLYYRKIAERCL